jgi:hypothetical protein
MANCRRSESTPPLPANNLDIFAPMQRVFALIRKIGTAITHEVGAFG